MALLRPQGRKWWRRSGNSRDLLEGEVSGGRGAGAGSSAAGRPGEAAAVGRICARGAAVRVSAPTGPGLGSPPRLVCLGACTPPSSPAPLLAVSGRGQRPLISEARFQPWTPLIRAQWTLLAGSLVRRFSEGPSGDSAFSPFESSPLAAASLLFYPLPPFLLMQVHMSAMQRWEVRTRARALGGRDCEIQV